MQHTFTCMTDVNHLNCHAVMKSKTGLRISQRNTFKYREMGHYKWISIMPLKSRSQILLIHGRLYTIIAYTLEEKWKLGTEWEQDAGQSKCAQYIELHTVSKALPSSTMNDSKMVKKISLQCIVHCLRKMNCGRTLSKQANFWWLMNNNNNDYGNHKEGRRGSKCKWPHCTVKQ